jgi:hypothetical protein
MASQSNPPLVSVVMQSDCPSAALTKIEILLAIIKAIDKTQKRLIYKTVRCEISFLILSGSSSYNKAAT